MAKHRVRNEAVTNYLVDVGKRIRLAREHCNLRQSEVAEKLGVQETTISLYESGHHEMPLGRLLEIAEMTGTTVAWLAAGVSAEIIQNKTIANGETSADNTDERFGRLERAIIGLAQQLSAAGIEGIHINQLWVIPDNHDVHLTTEEKKNSYGTPFTSPLSEFEAKEH